MSRRRGARLAALAVASLPLAAAWVAPASAAAGADAPGASALAHCAAIAAADARLACYDALAGRPVARATTPAAAAPAAAASGASAPNDPQNFGIAQVRVNEPPQGPTAIQAHVARVQDNGIARATVVLDNGQTWIFTEPAADAALSPGDAVTIKRALLGSFLLVTPAKHSYHVHRVQ